MSRFAAIFLTLLVFLFIGISASGAECIRQVVVTEWFSISRKVKVTDGEGHITGFRWDGMSRKTRTLWDEGSAVQRTEQAGYDGIVQLTRTDPKNQLTTYQYDALNRLENILHTGAATDNRHNTYDLVGNLLGVTYPNETAARQTLRGSSQTFDRLNRLAETGGSTTVTKYGHGDANNCTGKTVTVNGGALTLSLILKATGQSPSIQVKLTKNGINK